MQSNQSKAEFIKQWLSDAQLNIEDELVAQNPPSDAGPISIIGLDGVFADGNNVEGLWRAIENEQKLYSRFDSDRLINRAAKASQSDGPFVGGLLSKPFDFDPGFFKISASEAELMDPQLRLLLMSVQKSLDDAGYMTEVLPGDRVGVFIGCEGSEYNDAHVDKAFANNYMLNHAGCSIAHRLSYHFNFTGPSEVINTMCSSAAYCLFRATQLLRLGEIDYAIVGAAKVNFSPLTYKFLKEMNMSSSNDYCYSFHKSSEGYIRSEGVASIVLKRRDNAISDGDHIYANIRAIAANYNGKDGNSMFSPSKNGQKLLIKECIGRAGIEFGDLAFIEAQGMGNKISDFVEFNAFNEAYNERLSEAGFESVDDQKNLPVITTLKPVLGHMECVSALGALFKIIHSFQTKTVYKIPALSEDSISDKLDLEASKINLLMSNKSLDETQVNYAALNSFGASGSNVFAVISSELPADEKSLNCFSEDQILVVSAKNQETLKNYVKSVLGFIENNPTAEALSALIRCFQTKRTAYETRVAFLINQQQIDKACACLKAYLEDKNDCLETTIDNVPDSPFQITTHGVFNEKGAFQNRIVNDAIQWVSGAGVDWLSYYDSESIGGQRYRFPSYPFQMSTHSLSFNELHEVSPEITDTLETVPDSELFATSHRDAAEYVRNRVSEYLMKALKVGRDDLSNERSFADYGVDSVTGVNFVKTLNAGLGINLETITLFDYSSINLLTDHIVHQWGDALSGASGDIKPSSGQSASTVKKPLLLKRSTAKRAAKEPIAIVGMSGRFAESESLEEFWDHLKQGRNLVKEVSRWQPGECVSANSKKQTFCTQGSFIDSVDKFDASFFNISPLEAQYMDPQQRLFLEESWKALEHAGYAGKSIEGTRCGVFTGCNHADYMDLFDEDPPEQAFWGSAVCVIPARISYYLNLLGPAVMVDTACSSSLVSIHMACQSIWSGESEMALAGGVFLQVTPKFFQFANRASMLSPEGRCATFDESANGFAPGEGVGVVLLKPLSDALRDRDSIHGVIRGSATNQDGKTNGITAPSAISQEELECSVYDEYGIQPSDIQLVEAHGTGTKLGDPIEFGALSNAFRRYTDQKNYCAIGSVKTNIGHTAAAAGISGLLKVLLAIKHRSIPPSLHYRNGNPLINFDDSPFYVNTELSSWDNDGGEARTAAVSSFGFSGTNAHMVVSEAPACRETQDSLPGYLISLSAKTETQLRQQVLNLNNYISTNPHVSLNNIGFTLFIGRAHLSHRLACVVSTVAELNNTLEQWLSEKIPENLLQSNIDEDKVEEKEPVRRGGMELIRNSKQVTELTVLEGNLLRLAQLYIEGYDLPYHAVFQNNSGRIPLPLYPFSRDRYWLDGANPLNPPAGEGICQQSGLSEIESLIEKISEDSLPMEQGIERIRSLV